MLHPAPTSRRSYLPPDNFLEEYAARNNPRRQQLGAARATLANYEARIRRNTADRGGERVWGNIDAQLEAMRDRCAELRATIRELEIDLAHEDALLRAHQQKQMARRREMEVEAEFTAQEEAERARRFAAWKAARQDKAAQR